MSPAPAESAGSMRRLGRDTIIYGLGVVLSRAVAFLLLPVYTRYLSPADYGLLQLLQMVLDVTAIAVSAGTIAGVLRFYFKEPDEAKRKRIVVTALYLLFGLNLLGALLLAPAAPWIWKHALGSAGSPALVRIAACSFALDALVTVPMLLMQAERKAMLYSLVSLAKLVIGLVLNVVLVVGFGKGVGGILVANLVTSLLVGGALVAWMLRRTGARPSAAAARDLRRFGLPYQLVTAGTFVLTFGDRAFLQAFHGLTAVGLYGLAYQFGFVLIALTSAPFFRAWGPERLQIAAHASREVRDAKYNQAFRWLNLLAVGVAVGISLFASPLLMVMSDPAYRPAARLVPVLLAAFLVQIWTDVVSLGIEVSEQTRYASHATWIGVATILALYALLIPPFAGMGAAIATLGGFIVRFACFLRFSDRLWPVAWRWGQPLALVSAGALVVATSLFVPGAGLAAQFAVACALAAAFAAFAWGVVLHAAERRQLVGLLRAPRRAWLGIPSN